MAHRDPSWVPQFMGSSESVFSSRIRRSLGLPSHSTEVLSKDLLHVLFLEAPAEQLAISRRLERPLFFRRHGENEPPKTPKGAEGLFGGPRRPRRLHIPPLGPVWAVASAAGAFLLIVCVTADRIERALWPPATLDGSSLQAPSSRPLP